MIDTMTTRDYEKVRLHARRLALIEEIRQRWAWRSWYRTVARDMFGHRWDDFADQNTAELHRQIAALRVTQRRERTR